MVRRKREGTTIRPANDKRVARINIDVPLTGDQPAATSTPCPNPRGRKRKQRTPPPSPLTSAPGVPADGDRGRQRPPNPVDATVRIIEPLTQPGGRSGDPGLRDDADAEDDVEEMNNMQRNEVPGVRVRSIENNTLINTNATEMTSNMIANALLDTLRTISESGSRLGSRPAYLKELPTFTGDPLEWVHFEKRFHESTRDFGYSDCDNIERLKKALGGDAEFRNKTLLATARSAKLIMDSLELQFGNPAAIANRIFDDITGLPSITEGEATIVEFATGLNNALCAFKSLQLTDYLTDASLWNSAVSKIPRDLQMAFSDYFATASTNETRLESLSAFLLQKAVNAVKSGIVDLTRTSSQRFVKRNGANEKYVSRRPAKSSKAAVVCATADGRASRAVREREREGGQNLRCLLCCRENHKLWQCADFRSESTYNRWGIARRLRVCFKCLSGGHTQFDCKSKRACDQCHKPHHSLLHSHDRRTDNIDRDNQRDKSQSRSGDDRGRDGLNGSKEKSGK